MIEIAEDLGNTQSSGSREKKQKQKSCSEVDRFRKRRLRTIKLMLCSTWNYCMKKVVLKSAHISIVKRKEGFRK